MDTGALLRRFLDKGYVVVPDCFPKKTARACVESAYARMGCDPSDLRSWKEERIQTTGKIAMPIREFAPKAWSAICELVGGEERIDRPDLVNWLDSFIVKFPLKRPKAWLPPEHQIGGWHKDGGADLPHSLKEPKVGLVTFALFSDIAPKGGGTFLALDSIAPVARVLAAHPEGLATSGPAFGAIVRSCRRFAELTGKAGDVALMHPFMLHSESSNASGPPRFQTTNMIKLKDPLNLLRVKKGDHSPVESMLVDALG